jgi:hypothetical protein
MELGDSLLDAIYSGIDGSGFVILVMSKNSTESGWVNQEVNAALSKEGQLGRKFLIPIKIDDCTVPLKIADRLYASFASSFSEPFAVITRLLEKYRAKEMPVAPERELLAASFTLEVNLDRASFRRNLEHIKRRQPATQLKGDQIVVANDAEYEILRSRLYARLDDLANDPFYNHELEATLRYHAEKIVENERLLADGLALIANHHFSDLSAYWFAKLVRGRSVYNLWSAQRPNLPDELKYGKSWSCANLLFNKDANTFFEADSDASVDIFPSWEKQDEYFHMWASEEVKKRILDEDGAYTRPTYVSEAFDFDQMDKYLIPQMVLIHLRDGTRLLPDVRRAIVGLS